MGIVLCFSFLCFVYIFRFLDILILDKICLLWRNSIWGSDFLRISAPMLHTYLSEFMFHKKGDRSYTSTSAVLLCNWEYNCILHREHTVASTRYVLLSRTRTNLRWQLIQSFISSQHVWDCKTKLHQVRENYPKNPHFVLTFSVGLKCATMWSRARGLSSSPGRGLRRRRSSLRPTARRSYSLAPGQVCYKYSLDLLVRGRFFECHYFRPWVDVNVWDGGKANLTLDG